MTSIVHTHPSTVAVVFGTALLVKLSYSWLWPKPIPSIPHNPIASIWGDMAAISKAKKDDNMTFVEFLGHMVKVHGPISQVLIGPQVMVIVSDRREMERMLIEGKNTDQHKRMMQVFETIIPNSQIALPANEIWKRHRRLTGPSMSRRYLERMSVRIVTGASNLTKLWGAKLEIADSCTFEAGLDVQLATMDTIVSIAMGHSLGCIKSALSALPVRQIQEPSGIANFSRPTLPALYEAIVRLLEGLDRTCKVPFPLLYARIFNYGSPSWRKGYNSITTVLNNAFLEAQGRNDTTGHQGNSLSTDAECVLDMLLQQQAREGEEKFRKEEIFDELMMYIIAGQDTTASTLSWLLKYLPTDAEIQRRLHEELCKVFGQGENASEVVEFKLLDDPERVPILEAVVAETLRCAGVASLIPRQLLQDEMILGKLVPKGTFLVFATALMSRDQSEWGPDANEWRPARWLTPSGAFNRSAGPSFPFGLGQRSCFGQRLALLQLKAFLATMSREFFFKPVPQEVATWDAVELMTKQPKMCYVSLERWSSNSKEDRDSEELI
ncbi:cytochrome P450 [Rhizoctonia solani]|nr:cytochrome P450 [Rhizoctonia solani]